jgi:hypothetical protein
MFFSPGFLTGFYIARHKKGWAWFGAAVFVMLLLFFIYPLFLSLVMTTVFDWARSYLEP